MNTNEKTLNVTFAVMFVMVLFVMVTAAVHIVGKESCEHKGGNYSVEGQIAWCRF